MSEQPASISREARKINQSLKDLLKTREPFHREVDIERKRLRRQYLSLLLLHPNAVEAKDVENHLWMQTSYQFIATYKQRLAAIDRIIQNNQRQQQQQHQQNLQNPRNRQAQADHNTNSTTTAPAASDAANNHQQGPVEHRRWLSRFRTFLTEEEKFWTTLVLRLRRLFELQEAQPALEALGLLNDTEDIIISHSTSAPSNLPTSSSADSTTSPHSSTAPPGATELSDGNTEARDGVVHITTTGASSSNVPGANGGGRNHFQFPPEDPNLTFPPTSVEDKANKMAILSKALICLGDIARYRELYNESNGRPRAGHAEGPARHRRPRRAPSAATEMLIRGRTYDKAQLCYEQARSLVPDEGNPSHQLAILASYQRNSFTSLIHYYRALCVRQPYDTAAENLGTVLSRALDAWRQKVRKEAEREKNGMSGGGKNGEHLQPNVKVETLKERLVVTHALWRVALDKGIPRMEAIAPNLPEKVYNDFFTLVSDRELREDMISNIIVLSQGALWKHRMIRESPTPAASTTTTTTAAATTTTTTTTTTPANPQPPRGSSSHNHAPPETPTLVEWCILRHLLDLHTVLLEVGKEELRDPPPMDPAVDDLAQRISATFRRTLPALRIASKWLRGNIKYLMQDPEFAAYKKRTRSRGGVAASEQQQQQQQSGNANANTTSPPLPPPPPPGKLSKRSVRLVEFWQTYAQFVRLLAQVFPPGKLPAFGGPLEEDIEMRGWLPLRGLMGDSQVSIGKGGTGSGVGGGAEQVHPNVEQLMRISDLLADAHELARVENSPIRVVNNHILFHLDVVDGQSSPPPATSSRNTVPSEPAVPVRQQQLLANIRDHSLDLNSRRREDDDDQMTEVTSRTDDDVLRAAFDHVGNPVFDQENDENDDEIVWDPRTTSLSPVLSPSLQATPVTPMKPMLSPKNTSPRSPTQMNSKPGKTLPMTMSASVSTVAPTTAQDLLNNVMNGIGTGTTTRNINMNMNTTLPAIPTHVTPTTVLEPTAPQPLLLFGSDISHGPSIWSASRDEQSLLYNGSTAAVAAAHGQSGGVVQAGPMMTAGAGGNPSSTVGAAHLYHQASSPRGYMHQDLHPLGQSVVGGGSIWAASPQSLGGSLPPSVTNMAGVGAGGPAMRDAYGLGGGPGVGHSSGALGLGSLGLGRGEGGIGLGPGPGPGVVGQPAQQQQHHHRIPSSSLHLGGAVGGQGSIASQYHHSQLGPNDPSAYTPGPIQPPIHRPDPSRMSSYGAIGAGARDTTFSGMGGGATGAGVGGTAGGHASMNALTLATLDLGPQTTQGLYQQQQSQSDMLSQLRMYPPSTQQPQSLHAHSRSGSSSRHEMMKLEALAALNGGKVPMKMDQGQFGLGATTGQHQYFSSPQQQQQQQQTLPMHSGFLSLQAQQPLSQLQQQQQHQMHQGYAHGSMSGNGGQHYGAIGTSSQGHQMWNSHHG